MHNPGDRGILEAIPGEIRGPPTEVILGAIPDDLLNMFSRDRAMMGLQLVLPAYV